jgi:hypothetical protein
MNIYNLPNIPFNFITIHMYLLFDNKTKYHMTSLYFNIFNRKMSYTIIAHKCRKIKPSQNLH